MRVWMRKARILGAIGAAALIFAPLLVLVSIWLYTLVFAFAALWFAHFALAALQRLRQARAAPPSAGLIRLGDALAPLAAP